MKIFIQNFKDLKVTIVIFTIQFPASPKGDPAQKWAGTLSVAVAVTRTVTYTHTVYTSPKQTFI